LKFLYFVGPYADEILNFLDPFFSSLHLEELKLQKSEEGGSVLEAVVDRLRQYADQKKDEKEKLMKTMNVKRLLVPYIELNLPGTLSHCWKRTSHCKKCVNSCLAKEL
jgi:hypothetical protein